ncbi:hypothetical protein K2Z84_32565 [Candidatus Binatia bacterium]|jgi:hypothetical protein|nr:hypothetical protein [Candidatus Binatia bacterium]
MKRVIEHSTVVTAALALVACGSAIARAGDALEPVAVSISHVSVEAFCGQTPVPGQPEPHCPTTGTLALTYLGKGCTAGDFVIKLRQREADQVLRVFKRASATTCFVGDAGFDATFATLTVPAPDIDVWKPVRVANSLPLLVVPRP